MQKFRVWELAKQYNKTDKDIISTLKSHNVEVKSHLSVVDEKTKQLLDRVYADKQTTRSTETKTTSTKPAAAKSPATKPTEKQPRRRRPARTVRFDQQSGKPQEEFLVDGKGRKLETKPKAQARPQKVAAKPAAKPAHSKQATAKQAEPAKKHENGGKAQQKHAESDANALRRTPKKAQPTARPAGKPMADEGQRSSRPVEKRTHKLAQRTQPSNRNIADHNAPAKPEEASGNERGGRKGNRNQRRNQRGRNQNKNDRRGKERGTSLLAQSIKKSRTKGKNKNEHARANAEAVTEVAMPPSVTVKEIAELFKKEVGDVIKRLMLLGIMATINQEVDRDAVELLAEEYGITLLEMEPEEDGTEIPEIEDAPEDLLPRPPVVTIMGHVDHGKTSLLDTIRKTHVTAREAGGITQHIGAYQIRYQGKKVVFLDTPGHEAFTAMRARGAQVTDIAVLVVAADDGVMPQTLEAIDHAKAAKVPIIVAINKMDKPAANPDLVKQQLAEHGLLPEDWGGDTIMVPVSAKKHQGIDDLLENILLVADVLELKANPNRNAIGVVVEGELDKGRGPVVTVLIKNGTLRTGDGIVSGTAFGRVRAMNNERGDLIKKAEPSTPVEVLGLSDVPTAGELLYAMDERDARNIAEKRIAKQKYEEQNRSQKVTLDDLFNQIKEGELKSLNIVIKADVQGSVEALRQSFEGIKNPEVRIDVVHAGVGAISESDIMLASAANALIIGFNVRPDANIRKIAEQEQVDMRTYRVIYDAIDDIKQAMQGMLAPKFREVVLGRAEVRQVIPTPKVIVAGSYVTEGKITNNAELRLIRDGIVIHEGNVASLRRFKDDVKEVAEGYECGISIESYRDVKEGDVLEAFTQEEIEQTID